MVEYNRRNNNSILLMALPYCYMYETRNNNEKACRYSHFNGLESIHLKPGVSRKGDYF